MKDPIFKSNPKLESYFKTADGNAFFTEHDAKTHASKLKNKKVVIIEKKVAPKKENTPNIKVTEDTNIDGATYEELMQFAKDNEVALSGKKIEEVREAVRAYLANPNKKIVPFKGDLN